MPAQRVVVLLYSESQDRRALLRAELSMILPGSTIRDLGKDDLAAPGQAPIGDAALIDLDCGASTGQRDASALLRKELHPVTLLRARGFTGAVVVIARVPDEKPLCDAAESLGAIGLTRDPGDSTPWELAKVLAAAFESNARVTQDLVRARRIFAAGQAALSLQHAINNPLGALMAEAQLLQLEELNPEQRDSVDRMVELCRRITALVRQLDALPDG